MTKQTTNDDIMAMLSQFAESVDQRFEKQEKFNLELMKTLGEHNKRLQTIEETMATKNDINRLEGVIDGYAHKIDSYATEMAAMQHKINRLERMIDYLAEQAGISRQALESL